MMLAIGIRYIFVSIAGDQNEITDNPKFEATFISKGGGKTNAFENFNERLDFQINGTKWWVISVAGPSDAWNCKEFIKVILTYLQVVNFQKCFYFAAQTAFLCQN